MKRPFSGLTYSSHKGKYNRYSRFGGLPGFIGRKFGLGIAGVMLAAGSVAALTPSEPSAAPTIDTQQSQTITQDNDTSSNNPSDSSGQIENQHTLDITIKNDSSSNNNSSSHSEVIINGQPVQVPPNTSRHEKIINNESTVDITVNNSSYSSTSQSQQNSSSTFIEFESYSSSSDDTEDSARDINRRR